MRFDGKILKEIRTSQGMSQRFLARQVGCKGTDIHRYEAGLVTPKIERIEAIAGVLGVAPAVLSGVGVGGGVGGGGGGNWTPREALLIQNLLELGAVRRAKLIGYVEGVAAKSPRPDAAADLAAAAETAKQRASASPGDKKAE